VINRPPEVPEFAEEVEYLDFKTTKRVPSQFAPSVNALVTTAKCPGCGTERPEPKLSLLEICACGLHSYRYSALSIFIWRVEIMDAAPPSKEPANV
jgi:hypothetical protein